MQYIVKEYTASRSITTEIMRSNTCGYQILSLNALGHGNEATRFFIEGNIFFVELEIYELWEIHKTESSLPKYYTSNVGQAVLTLRFQYTLAFIEILKRRRCIILSKVKPNRIEKIMSNNLNRTSTLCDFTSFT